MRTCVCSSSHCTRTRGTRTHTTLHIFHVPCIYSSTCRAPHSRATHSLTHTLARQRSGGTCVRFAKRVEGGRHPHHLIFAFMRQPEKSRGAFWRTCSFNHHHLPPDATHTHTDIQERETCVCFSCVCRCAGERVLVPRAPKVATRKKLCRCCS